MSDCVNQIIKTYLPSRARLLAFKIFDREKSEKRSRYDYSKKLVIYFENDSREICRTVVIQQNNQSVKIHTKEWFDEDFAYLTDLPVNMKNQFHWSKNLGSYQVIGKVGEA